MDKLDIRRVSIYLLIAFGFSWTVGLIIFLTGGIVGSPQIEEGVPITWAFVLLILYMFGPTLGNIGARLFTKEGLSNLWLRPKIKQGWKYWLMAWFLTPLLVIAGAVVYFLISPEALSTAILAGDPVPGIPDIGLPNWLMVAGLIIISILITPLANGLAILGEEFGWRAYLQPKLLPLGQRKMYLLVGLIWGIWHWPVIWMGYNYPGHPVLGSLAMVWFAMVVGTFFGWTTLRAGSVWPAVIGHAVLNGLAGLPILFLAAETNPLVGPLAVGVIGSIFFALTMFLILWKAVD